MNVSIIIVNYNTSEHLKKCLDSIIKFTNDVVYEIIVVDNNSPNRDIENFPQKYPVIKFLFRDHNEGFGTGCNYGAQKSIGKYLLFVNPDVIFKQDVISIFLKYMEEHINVSLCSGLHEDENGKLIYSFNSFPNLVSDFREAFYIGYNKHIRNLLKKDEIQRNETFEIDFALGALLFVRRKDFESVGGFDERFFLYCEDVDLGHRLKNIGKIICISSVRVFHFYNSSVKQIKGKHIQTFHINRSKMIYMYKHYSFFKRNFIRVFMILGISLRLMYLPFNKVHKENRVKDFKRIFNGLTVYFKKYNIEELGRFKCE